MANHDIFRGARSLYRVVMYSRKPSMFQDAVTLCSAFCRVPRACPFIRCKKTTIENFRVSTPLRYIRSWMISNSNVEKLEWKKSWLAHCKFTKRHAATNPSDSSMKDENITQLDYDWTALLSVINCRPSHHITEHICDANRQKKKKCCTRAVMATSDADWHSHV